MTDKKPSELASTLRYLVEQGLAIEEMAPQIRRAVSRAVRDAAAGRSPAPRSTEDAPGGGGAVCDRCGASLSPGQPRFGPAERHWDCRDMSPPEEPPLHVDSPGVQDGESSEGEDDG